MVLKIIQQLIRVKSIPFKIFDDAVEIITTQSKNQSSSNQNQGMTEAQIIYHKIESKIGKFDKSPFIKFLYQYLTSIRSKMWSKSCLESEGSFAISCEIIRTIRLMYEENSEPA